VQRRAERAGQSALPRRVAMLSVHTSPLDAPGGGDAGGLNVYVVETALRLADRGIAVEIFTRATASDQQRVVEIAPGVAVRHITAGPLEALPKDDLPAQLCAFTAGVLRTEARHEPGWYDVIHSHYWLSGQVGWLVRDRWGVPLVHSAHTLAKVKNTLLAAGDIPEPRSRVIGEEQVVAEADRLIASTAAEATELIRLYDADPDSVCTVAPGVDLSTFAPAPKAAARASLGLKPDAPTLLFVGRIQPLKAPDLLLRAAKLLTAQLPDLQVVVVGGPSGSGLAEPDWLAGLAAELDLGATLRFVPPADRQTVAQYYQAADATVVPSHTESFGLVALESQACGTPVVAAAVGGLTTAVAHGFSGLLVDGHEPQVWAKVLGELLGSTAELARLSSHARAHASTFSWDRTTDGLLVAYREAIAELNAPRMSVAQ
jgi:D-inositol-3-phosphate glycosyltransferase